MPAGVVTALRAQQNDSQRVNVFIEGEFALGVSLSTLSREGLHVGKVLDEAAWVRLETSESADKAFHAALRLLNARPRATAELRERLLRKEFAPQAIDAAIDRLTGLGLLDDRAFAHFWIENRQISKPRGAQALRDELRRKGVAREVADAALDDTGAGNDEHGKAMTLARSALRRYAAAADRAAFQRRLGGYLQRRGFTFEIIAPIVDKLWNELKSGS